MDVIPKAELSISVIIPSYNRWEATKRAVRSALSQTYPPMEVIVVDDGSERPVSFERLGITDARLRIIRLDRNSGAAAARQCGVEAARGSAVAFLDSDDVWLPDKLASQVGYMETSGLVVVACGWAASPESDEELEYVLPRESRNASDFAAGCWFAPGSTLLLPREVFNLVGPFNCNLRRLEDYEWFLRFALLGGKLLVAPKIGAIVSIGNRSRLNNVMHAKIMIENVLAAERITVPSWHFRRLSQAYLSLELAKAAQNEKRYLLMLSHLLRSFFFKPRFQIALEQWWPVRFKLNPLDNNS